MRDQTPTPMNECNSGRGIELDATLRVHFSEHTDPSIDRRCIGKDYNGEPEWKAVGTEDHQAGTRTAVL